MSRRRFLVEPGAVKGNRAEVSGPELRHLRDVLRLRPGDEVELLDPRGAVLNAVIEEIGRRHAALQVTGRRDDRLDDTCLAAGVLKGTRMDLVVEKAVEFGIRTLVPLMSRNSAAKTPHAGRIERWQRVAAAACKQCGRAVPLEIAAPTPLDLLLARTTGFSVGLMLHEKEEKTPARELAALPWDRAGLKIVLVGPEGGFSAGEAEAAARAGFFLVGLGQRVLRAETAAMAAMTIIRLFSNDDNGGNRCGE